MLARTAAGFARLVSGRHVGPLLALTLLHLTAYSRNLHGTKDHPAFVIPYDFFNSYARFLIFISDCLRKGALPLWFPYGHAGTPFFINPQSQMWSPVTWIVSLVLGYDPLRVQQQQFFFILFGSVGVYFLAHSLWSRRSGALLAAIAFNFTSARLCNAQHMDIVTAFSLFPWVFLGIRRLAQGQWLAVPGLGAVLGLLVVSGYPGVVLVSPLWFGSWAAWSMATACPDRKSRKRFLFGLGASVTIGAGVSAGYWLPLFANTGAFTRGEPLATDAALNQGLSPGDYWHLIYGASTRLATDGFTTDISMRGLYFGVVALAFAVYAASFRRCSATAALGVGFLLALVMSLGRLSFVRVALHDWLPFLNVSRFPAADSRAVAALAGSLLAGGGLAHLRDDPEGKRRVKWILVGLIVLMLVGHIWLKTVIYPGATPVAYGEYFTNAIQFELLALCVALVALIRCVRPRALLVTLVSVAAFDSGTHLLTDTTLYGVPNTVLLQRMNDIHSKEFDAAKALLPRITSPRIDDAGANDAYLNKAFYLSSYTPFQLKRLHALLARGFLPFFSLGPRVVGVAAPDAPSDQGAVFQKQATAVTFKITHYLPCHVGYVVDVPVRTVLVFNEIYFPGWRARINGRASVPMLDVSDGLRGLVVEAGTHTIVTRFLPASFVVGLTITLLSWLLVAAWLLRAWWRGHKERAVTPATTAAGDTSAGRSVSIPQP